MNNHTTTPQKPRRLATGFTLIELLIVVAIVGILSAIAYPAYTKYIQKSRRADALGTLAQTQVTFERCYAQTFSYSAACGSMPLFPIVSAQGYYSIAQSNLTATTFTLTATPTGAQAADTKCASISTTESNVRSGLDTSSAVQTECWNP